MFTVLVGQPLVKNASASVRLAQTENAFLSQENFSRTLNQQELEPFLDQFFQKEMAQLHVPGVAFSLVKDDEVLISKGYGFADLEKKTPVSPDTMFRAGSVSKVLTATAILQL